MIDPNDPTIQTEDDFRNMVEANRVEAMLSAGKRQEYTKAMVFKYGKQFWELMEQRAMSGNPKDEELFIKEYAKLNAKTLPTELSGPNGSNIGVDLIGILGHTDKLKESEDVNPTDSE